MKSDNGHMVKLKHMKQLTIVHLNLKLVDYSAKESLDQQEITNVRVVKNKVVTKAKFVKNVALKLLNQKYVENVWDILNLKHQLFILGT